MVSLPPVLGAELAENRIKKIGKMGLMGVIMGNNGHQKKAQGIYDWNNEYGKYGDERGEYVHIEGINFDSGGVDGC